MGREARNVKLRVCKECNQEKRMSVAQLREHAAICKVMNRLGLYAPDDIRNTSPIPPPQ